MSLKTLSEREQAFFGGDIHACPLRGHSTSFQLVDEIGDGRAYAGLTYQLIDYEDIRYPGTRDASDLKVHHEARYWQAEHSV